MAAISTGTGTFAGGCAVSSSLRAKAPRTERNRRERCRRERKLKPVAAMGAGDFKRRKGEQTVGAGTEAVRRADGSGGRPSREASAAGIPHAAGAAGIPHAEGEREGR
ncbi:unnamed protein product [Miscanthus lutarioriparius]|uniref:Uncharacterized protein n=1 Tax=Miscanthus lutarioriparius TaxID=422564 RepID=A0A811MSW2_9POAL|nr:unnamed protein product [Miscanthus lutarioriparius]